MSDAVQPAVAEVRAAAEAVKTAIDVHLAAVERRTGDGDTAVYSAYEKLAAAAEAYDAVLDETYDEMTPFEVVTGDPEATAPEEGATPEAISVLIRRDYLLADPRRLVVEARRVAFANGELAPSAAGGGTLLGTGGAVSGAGGTAHQTAEPGEQAGEAASVGAASGMTAHTALRTVFDEYEPDEIASRCEEFGLEDADSTLWVTTAEPRVAGEWLDEPFDDADPERIIFRSEISSFFEDELGDDSSMDDEELEPFDREE